MSSAGMAQLARRPALRRPSRDDVLVAVTLGPEGEAVALWASAIDAAALVGRTPAAPSEASFPVVEVGPPVRVRVTRQNARGRVLGVTTINGFRFAHPRLAVFSSGDLVVAGGRCRWSEREIVPNAAVYSPTGRVLGRGVLGDGVHALATTRHDELWVGYFDEGIYGSFGWGSPGPTPIGAPGLLRFSRSFDLVWRYPDEPAHPIDDGPSLNLVGDTLWMTHDSGYPVVRIVDDELTVWASATGPASAVLVEGDTVALVGRRATIGSLEEGMFRPTAACDLELPPRPVGWVSRGAALHVFDSHGGWLTTDVAALRAAGTPV